METGDGYIELNVGSLKARVALADLLNSSLGASYSCFYSRPNECLINGLCDRFGSDKGTLHPLVKKFPWWTHSYADFISHHFGHCRDYIKNVFECGMGTTDVTINSNMSEVGSPGASLRVWKDYFRNANIFGADIDRKILFSDERITTYWCDQTDKQSIASMWEMVGNVQFDLMIDDGLHTFEAGVCLLENSFHKLRMEGIYIIEDVAPGSLVRFCDYFTRRGIEASYVCLYRKHTSLHDNSLVVLRKTREHL